MKLALLALAACASRPEPARVDVGTEAFIIEDSRPDPLHADLRRTWIVQVYYPARPTPPSAYADDPQLIEAMVRTGYYEATPAELRGWLSRRSSAARNAPPAQLPHTVITLSPGLGFARMNYGELAAALVRRGYLVAVIDHPYLGISRVGDRLVRADDDPLLQSENPADALPRVREWTRDISVVLDELPRHGFPFEHAVAAGHSIGGTAAIGACEDPRVIACIDFEGFLEGIDVLARGSAKPILAAFSRAKGRPVTRKPGEPDPMDAIASQLAQRHQAVWIAKVTGGSHTSFSDAPDVLPRTLSRFGGELMTPARSSIVYSSLVDAFVRGQLEATLPSLPEVTATRH